MALDSKARDFQASASSYLQQGLWDVCTGTLYRPGGSLEDSAKR